MPIEECNVTGKRRLLHLAGRMAGIAGALWLVGCAGPTEVLNAQFLQDLGVGGTVASLPGEAPALLVEVENDTGRPIEYQLSWRDADGDVERFTGVLPADDKSGMMLFCPVVELTLGDVSDLTSTGAIVRLGSGGSNDPYIEVEPFGILLQDEINYHCGDSVTFAVLRSDATLSGFQVYAFIRRSGAQTPTETP
jgi:hypothetical protein